MRPRVLNLISPQTHRRIDLLTFPTPRCWPGGTAGQRAWCWPLPTVEGVATLTTSYPPVAAGVISFCTHNRWAAAHGLLVAILSARLPSLTPFGRQSLAVLSVMPITMSLLSDQSAAAKVRTRPRGA